jgi:hypothetical protein
MVPLKQEIISKKKTVRGMNCHYHIIFIKNIYIFIHISGMSHRERIKTNRRDAKEMIQFGEHMLRGNMELSLFFHYISFDWRIWNEWHVHESIV